MLLKLIEKADLNLLLFFNSTDNNLLNNIIIHITTGTTWLLLYAIILLVIIKNAHKKQAIYIILAVLLCVAFTASVDNLFVKPFFQRIRPCNDVNLNALVIIKNNYVANGYSFFSAHSANTFSAAMLLSLILRHKFISIPLFTWALINCYTRVYLAVHFPSDVIGGIAFGALSAFIFYKMYVWFCKQKGIKYTITVIKTSSLKLLNISFILTIIVVLIISVVQSF